ncbi:hypothetical protein, partial [Moorena sp. SIO3I6]|uniref:hypothetical protein n=1 Tax=Moorena sp. SIO3I6 TaxID=2607831 RepID=UPI0025F09A31
MKIPIRYRSIYLLAAIPRTLTFQVQSSAPLPYLRWTPQWQNSRWNYSMSFFQSEGDKDPTWMSFYSYEHLQ